MLEELLQLGSFWAELKQGDGRLEINLSWHLTAVADPAHAWL